MGKAPAPAPATLMPARTSCRLKIADQQQMQKSRCDDCTTQMKMTSIMNGNHHALKKALTRLGWMQSDLARQAKIRTEIIRDIINRGKSPTENEANAIQRALGEAGEYLDVFELWPATFAMPATGHERDHQPEVQLNSLWNHPEALQLAAPEDENEGLEEAVEMLLSRLPKRTYEILKQRYWKRESHEQIGGVLGVTRARVQQIESRAFRTLKHPAWIRKLGAYLPRNLKSGNFVIRNDGSILAHSTKSHPE
jgi:RNA polymerase sigma factor (sigma-70 family)